MLRGYLSDEYGAAFGTVRGEYSKGQFIERPIYGTDLHDITNTYPILACYNPEDIIYDIVSTNDRVSALIITDPMDYFDYGFWNNIREVDGLEAFDVVRKYKEHYVVDFSKPWKLAENHLRNVKKSLKTIDIKIRMPLNKNSPCYSDSVLLVAQDFNWLYSNLISRHSIVGMADFTSSQIIQMLMVPGTIVFEARDATTGDLLGMALFYLEDVGLARYHLAAYKDYTRLCGFGLIFTALEYLKTLGVEKVCLGAGSGTVTNSEGLARYKAGFANDTRNNYLLFKVLNQQAYDELTYKCQKHDHYDENFLPAYRG